MNDAVKHGSSKVPEIVLGFWIVKILATTLGETGGDTVTGDVPADVELRRGALPCF